MFKSNFKNQIECFCLSWCYFCCVKWKNLIHLNFNWNIAASKSAEYFLINSLLCLFFTTKSILQIIVLFIFSILYNCKWIQFKYSHLKISSTSKAMSRQNTHRQFKYISIQSSWTARPRPCRPYRLIRYHAWEFPSTTTITFVLLLASSIQLCPSSWNKLIKIGSMRG